MPLKNYQYQRILKEYDRRRLQSRNDLEKRKQEVYAKIPELSELDQKIREGSVRSAKASLLGHPEELNQLAQKNQILSNKKLAVLSSYGYPVNYLEPAYFCPDCQDTGYIGKEKCHCFKQAVVDLIYSQSNVKDIIVSENFKNFRYSYYNNDTPDPVTGLTPFANMKTVMGKVKNFILNFETSGENLVIYGNTGVGKTFLSHCIAGELLSRGYTVIYLTAFELFHILECYSFDRDRRVQEDYESQFENILDCDLLIIDDLGTELSNSFINSQFYLCINERYLKKNSTIISSNLSLQQIGSTYSERILSRLSSNYTLLRLFGKDIRILKQLVAT